MSAHTPGEWRAIRVGDQWRVVANPDEEFGGTAIASIEIARPGFSSPLDAADAKLMAAAKDMLKALKGVAESRAIRVWVEGALNDVLSAIAKAEGRS
jgi:hypothetical protein